ncbi:MAG: peptide/nickel transport system ATP-binding protein [Frankiaceae bacterium]|jgi:oligopeptide transport system ATP-binding protein|nr:peptide/nickel transport system ATP-binding protein [Frankiaceae bacterium]
MTEPILRVEGLRTHFTTDRGVVKAVDGVDFEIPRGGILGMVGESGSGKSVTGLSILRLLGTPNAKIVGGRVLLDGEDLLLKSEREMRAIRGARISMVFQNAMTSLDAFFTVGDLLVEVIRLHHDVSKKEARERALHALELVHIPDPARRLGSYPHELSGGQRQRVVIALALSCEPDLLIADEPTTALDATVQKQIIELLLELNATLGTAILMVTHDFGVVAKLCRTVAVMYAGRIVERGDMQSVLESPQHPYTRALMECVPRVRNANATLTDASTHRRGRRLFEIGGTPPIPIGLGEGCAFAARCPEVRPECASVAPPTAAFGADHQAVCHACADTKREVHRVGA